MSMAATHPVAVGGKRKPFYKDLSILVLIAIVVGVLFGYFWPTIAVTLQPLGSAFIRMIRAVIGLVIFFTVVAGIGSMQNMGRVGRLGGVALAYFLALSTFALLVGLLVGVITEPGAGFNVDAAKLDAKAVAGYAGAAQKMSVVDFLMNIIPDGERLRLAGPHVGQDLRHARQVEIDVPADQVVDGERAALVGLLISEKPLMISKGLSFLCPVNVR